jgi:hypothetical protein
MKRVNNTNSSSHCGGSDTNMTPSDNDNGAASAAKKNRTSNSNIKHQVAIASLQQETSPTQRKYLSVCLRLLISPSHT